MIRSRQDSLMVRTTRSAYALRFGDRGGRRTTCTSAAASVSRKATVNRGSRSWIRKRFPVRKPSPTSVRLRAIWLIHALSGSGAMPAMWMRRGQGDQAEHCEPRQPETGPDVAPKEGRRRQDLPLRLQELGRREEGRVKNRGVQLVEQ